MDDMPILKDTSDKCHWDYHVVRDSLFEVEDSLEDIFSNFLEREIIKKGLNLDTAREKFQSQKNAILKEYKKLYEATNDYKITIQKFSEVMEDIDKELETIKDGFNQDTVDASNANLFMLKCKYSPYAWNETFAKTFEESTTQTLNMRKLRDFVQKNLSLEGFDRIKNNFLYQILNS